MVGGEREKTYHFKESCCFFFVDVGGWSLMISFRDFFYAWG